MSLPPEKTSADVEGETKITEQDKGSESDRDSSAQGLRPALILTGTIGRVPKGGWTTLVRWLSGWAVACWVGRLFAAAVGVRRSAEIELLDGTLRVRSQTVILGRLIQESEQFLAIESLQRVLRQSRYPALYLAVGVIALSLGVLLGGNWAFEGVISGDLVLLAGVLLALAGSALDVILTTIWYGRSAKVAVEIDAQPGLRLRLVGVSTESADRILHELAERLKKRTMNR